MQTTVYWNDPKEVKPIKLQAVLVMYNGTVWSGVYANEKVTLYPEDFGVIRLTDCELWAAFPFPPGRD